MLQTAFTVLPQGEAKLETNLILPGVFGRHATATIYVEYAKTGTVAMPAPILILQSADPNNSDRPILTLDQSKLLGNYWSEVLPPGTGNSVQIYATGKSSGLLLPGEKVSVPVYYAGMQQPWDFSDQQVELELRVHEADSDKPVQWSSM